MRWIVLSLCLLGCSPTCKDACEKIYLDTLCGKEVSHDPELIVPGCTRRCRQHKTEGVELDTGGTIEELSSDYTWVDCVTEATCEELTTYPYQCEMIW